MKLDGNGTMKTNESKQTEASASKQIEASASAPIDASNDAPAVPLTGGMHWIKFYPADWLAEPCLRLVSVAARGLWIDCLCLMHTSPVRGVLSRKDGKAYTLEQLARVVGDSLDIVTASYEELTNAEVVGVDPQGRIYSRRMLRDAEEFEQMRQKRVASGRAGGKASGVARRSKKTEPKRTNAKQTRTEAEAECFCAGAAEPARPPLPAARRRAATAPPTGARENPPAIGQVDPRAGVIAAPAPLEAAGRAQTASSGLTTPPTPTNAAQGEPDPAESKQT